MNRMKVAIFIAVALTLGGCASSRKSGPHQSATVTETQKSGWTLRIDPPATPRPMCLKATTEVTK